MNSLGVRVDSVFIHNTYMVIGTHTHAYEIYGISATCEVTADEAVRESKFGRTEHEMNLIDSSSLTHEFSFHLHSRLVVTECRRIISL